MSTNRVFAKTETGEEQRELLLRLLAKEGIKSSGPALVSGEGADHAPLSYAQKRVWFLDRLQPGNNFYNVVLSFGLDGDLDAEVLKRCLQEVVRRHGALRTQFFVENGEPWQRVETKVEVPLPLVDLSEFEGEQERRQLARQIVDEEGKKPFDLGRAPLLRCVLVRLGAREHVLGLSVHHIVFDEWSLGVMQRELAALYAGYARGDESPISEMPVQYADYALWQQEWLQGEVFGRQLEYWKKQLGGMPRELELDTDHPRPAMPLHRDSVATLEVARELWEGLKEVSRRENVTLFMTLLAAYEVLLLRYSGQEDFGVGMPVANRNHVQSEGVIGFCVNTMVMRAELSGKPSFRDVLARVRKAALEGFGHQDVPFERLVEELAPQRDLSRTPLFQVLFTLRSELKSKTELGGMQFTLSNVAAATLCDLALMVSDYQTPTLILNYDGDLFDPATTERMLKHYEGLLHGIVADAGQGVWGLALLSEAEERQLHEWNQTQTEYPRDRSMVELFTEQVERRSDELAIVFGEERITYRELDRRSNQLGHYLRKLGVVTESLVGICLERGIEMVVAALGILKAGGAYVPLDPVYPQERLQFMVEDAALAVVITRGRQGEQLSATTTQLVCLDRDWSEVERQSDERPAGGAGPEHLAYVIYTSGSTGRPKAVMVTQRGLIRLLRNTNYVQLRDSDVVAQTANASFDPATFEIWGALLNGARLVVIPNDVLLDGKRLAAEIQRQGVKVMFLATALFNELAVRNPETFSSLEQLFFGGEAAHLGAVTSVLNCGSGPERLVDVYGPAECTTYSSWFQANGMPKESRSVPIGRPVSNTQLYVLDREMNLTPVGVAGELYVGGEGVGRGYWRRPELTGEKFVPNPHGAQAGERLYRTGDRAKWQASGLLEFLGRVDSQIKIRGFRVELGEIEAALRQEESVQDCAVVLQEGAEGKRLVAYVVGELGGDELRKYLKGRLPEYMVPSLFVRLPELPLNSNGKVDRRALLEVAGERLETTGEYEPPRNAVEERLSGIWAEVLGVERVGVHDNFFELGGHSLLATLLAARMQQALQIDVPVRALFESPTIAQLAEEMEPRLEGWNKNQKDGGSETVGISFEHTVNAGSVVRLSYAQERLWFLDQLQPEGDFYNVPMAFALRGKLGVERLERCLQEVVRRHGALRTRFVVEGGEPVQKIEPVVEVRLPVIDLREIEGEAERRQRAEQILKDEGKKPFDLGHVPLLRCVLLCLGEEEHILEMTMHHIVCDDWSLGVLWRELAALYEGYGRGEMAPLQDTPVQYADYAAWQREWLHGERYERQMEYWKKQLAGMPGVLELATDKPRPATQSFKGRIEKRTLRPDLWAKLKEVSRREGVTPFMTLLAAYEVLLLRYTGQEDFGVGSVLANRSRMESEGVIGFFVNTVVMRAQLGGSPGFREILGRVRKAALEGFEHEDLPFERLVEELAPERDVSRTPMFQVMFTMRNTPVQRFEFGGLQGSEVEVDVETSKCDLTLIAEDGEQSAALTWNYSSDLFERATMERMIAHYESLLRGIVADAGQGIWDLPLLSAAEEQQLHEWNQTRMEYSRDATVVELFEEQVARRGDKVAVVFGEEQISYRELDMRSNQVGHYLRALGIGPESLVGICMERGIEMVVATLGIVKSGGAYVPLDPEHSQERLRFMLGDAGLSVVLTQERHAEHLPQTAARLVCVDREWSDITKQSELRPKVQIEPENLACAIFAESAARPKSVMLRHTSLTNLAAWHQRVYELAPSDRVGQVATAAVDVFVTGLWPYLASGSSLHIADRKICSSSAQLAVWMRQQEITIGLLAEHQLKEVSAKLEAAPGLRLVLTTGGEAQHSTGGAFQLSGHYGLPESSAFATFTPAACSAGEHATIGRPIANIVAYILDRNLQRAAIGVPGELWIAGAGVARGYLNHSDLTAERFLPNPFSPDPGMRMVRTGNRARYREDGNIELMGRLDNQVQIHGQEIDLREIEAVLETHQSVQQVVVVTRMGERAEMQLVAYLVSRAGQRLDKNELRAHVERQLGPNMTPTSFVTLPDLPRNSDGQLDRRSLSGLGGAQLTKQHVTPRTELEQIIASAWQEVLGLKTVSVHDNFFDSGGHSLLIIHLHRKLCADLALDIELIHLFQFPTIDSLSRFLQAGYNFSGKTRSVRERAGKQKGAIQKLKKVRTSWTENHTTE